MSRSDRPLSSHGRVLIGVSWYRMSAPPDGTLRVAVRNIRGARVCLTSTAGPAFGCPLSAWWCPFSRCDSQWFVAGRTLASMGESSRGKGIARAKNPLRQTTERGPNGVRPPSRRGGILSQGLDPGGLPDLGSRICSSTMYQASSTGFAPLQLARLRNEQNWLRACYVASMQLVFH